MFDRELKSLLLKMINALKEDSNKQINEVRKSIQDLDKKVSNMKEKFSKEMENMKKRQVGMLAKETSINQIKTIVLSSEMEDKTKDILHTDNHKNEYL
jgi:uncharacterized protein YeaO (DUF488 family)